jgi:hypothetical protein
MAAIKNVGVKDLKNNLSAYLRDVRRGTRILVSDRNTIVAELHEPGAAYTLPEPWDPVVADWIREGVVVPSARKKMPLEASPVSLEDGTALRLLEQDRGEPDR